MIRKISTLLWLFLLGCGSGDYSIDLGEGYSLERTNSCCIFIFSKNVRPVKIGNSIEFDNRVVKPLVKKLYVDKKKIIGYKVTNQCCHLTDFEKNHSTVNGFFIIHKKNGKITEGLNREQLIELNISLENMKEIEI